MSANENTSAVQKIERALLENADIERVARVTVITVDADTLAVAAKISLAPELSMRQVSAIVAISERRIAALEPRAKHIFITPDVYIDPHDTASTSAIVTLSYD